MNETKLQKTGEGYSVATVGSIKGFERPAPMRFSAIRRAVADISQKVRAGRFTRPLSSL